MKTIKYILILISLSCFVLPFYGQENTVNPDRTPEQEATRQTEKLQQELNLSTEQSKQVYDINIRYEKQRQISNSRSEAMERIKNKNADLEKVLTEEQNNRLQSKRYERTSGEMPSSVHLPQNYNASGFRSSTEYRTRPSQRVITIENNVRNNFRSGNPTLTRTQVPQTIRTNPPANQGTTRTPSNPAPTRSAIRSSSTPTRTESTVPPVTRTPTQNNNSRR